MKYRTLKDNLEKHYEATLKTSSVEEFLSCASDYIDYIKTTSFLNSKIKSLEARDSVFEKTLQKKAGVLNRSLDDLVGRLERILASCPTNEKVQGFFKEIHNQQLGERYSVPGKPESILNDVYSLLRSTTSTEQELIKEIAWLSNDKWNLDIDSIIESYYQQKEVYNQKRKTELWGCWARVFLIPDLNFYSITGKIRPSKEPFDDSSWPLSFGHLLASLHLHKEQEFSTWEGGVILKSCLRRLHFYLITSLDKAASAKIWTLRGFFNLFNADVGPFLVAVFSTIISLLIGFLLGKLQ